MTESAPIILTTAPSTTHAAQIIYGLELRGIKANAIPNPTRSRDPHAIVLTKGDEAPARAAIEVIWDALLESTPRALDFQGNCYFCGYNILGLAQPVTCPECGHSIDSIESRRAVAEGRIE